MRFIQYLIGTALVLLLPSAALAAETTFTFGSGNTIARWVGIGPIEISSVASGLRVTTTNGTGTLLTEAPMQFVPDSGVISLSSKQPITLGIVWSEGDEGETVILRRASIDIPPGERQQATTAIRPEEWTSAATRVGISLPPDTTIILHELQFQRAHLLQKIWHGFASFWSMDSYRPYHINFLWGPLLAWTAGGRARLWHTVPPPELPAMLVCNIVVLVAVMMLLGWGRISSKTRRARRAAILLFVVAWLVMDLRMGLEYLTWVSKDIQWAMTTEAGDAEFRDRGHFYNLATLAAALVADRSSYIFMAPREWPYLGNIRYYTYPAIPGRLVATDDTWVIFDRPEMTVGADGRLMENDVPITIPGTVLGSIAPGSFVFRTFASPSPSPQ